jgi:hypothetical protein
MRSSMSPIALATSFSSFGAMKEIVLPDNAKSGMTCPDARTKADHHSSLGFPLNDTSTEKH